MDDNRIDPGHTSTRDTLRVIGPILVVVGALFMIVAFVNFFSSFGRPFSQPDLFWCFFVGGPLLAAGIHLTRLGYMGRIMRYMSQEMAPPAKDTFNYMADGTKDGIKTVAGAVAEGLRQGSSLGSPPPVRCQSCSTMNSSDAKFCIHCGQALIKSRMCPNCNELNDPRANFCENCGHAFK
jgi:hypothetical protein